MDRATSLTIRETYNLLNISRQTLLRRIKEGELQVERNELSGAVRITFDALNAFWAVCAARATRDIEESSAELLARAQTIVAERDATRELAKRMQLAGPGGDWPTIRELVIARDGYTCGLCGGAVAERDVHVDHILPRSKGGTNDLTNLRVAHSFCNLSRSNREDWQPKSRLGDRTMNVQDLDKLWSALREAQTAYCEAEERNREQQSLATQTLNERNAAARTLKAANEALQTTLSASMPKV